MKLGRNKLVFEFMPLFNQYLWTFHIIILRDLHVNQKSIDLFSTMSNSAIIRFCSAFTVQENFGKINVQQNYFNCTGQVQIVFVHQTLNAKGF